MFRIDPKSRQSDRIEEVDFARLGLRERQHIQEWVAANPGILGEDLLIIGKEFSGFDRTSERLDLLAVDSSGRLVVIELKRNDTGADAHWQAIKYASYFQRTKADEIVSMAAAYWDTSQDDAVTRLLEHLGADDLNALNNSIDLRPQEESGKWLAIVLFENRRKLSLPALDDIRLNAQQEIAPHGIYVFVRTGPDTLNDNFANEIAEILRKFIVEITPAVDDLENEGGEDDEA